MHENHAIPALLQIFQVRQVLQLPKSLLVLPQVFQFNDSINSLKSWLNIVFPAVVFLADLFQRGQPLKIGAALPVGKIRGGLAQRLFDHHFGDLAKWHKDIIAFEGDS